MPLSKKSLETVLEICRKDLAEPLTVEERAVDLKSALGEDGFLVDLLVEKLRAEKACQIGRLQAGWFAVLGWWLAKLFMWGAVFFAGIAFLLGGAKWADPFTWGTVGAILYYVAIQVFTPMRLSGEAKHLQSLEEGHRIEFGKKLDQIARELESRKQ